MAPTKRNFGFWTLDLAQDGFSVLDSQLETRNLKLETFHLITLSALASTLGGIVRPISLAVLRLMTSSNFVGCSTGISAGLAPLRILSTIDAARLNGSVMSGP
jgi:hypothetical protein